MTPPRATGVSIFKGLGDPFPEITSEFWNANFRLDAEPCFVATHEAGRAMKA
jgi:hypothetical protein